MQAFKKKWGIVAKAAAIALPLLGVKALLDFFNLDLISVGPVITALVAGVFFVLAIILTGVLGDFKESEKIPGELALSVKSLDKDSRLLGKEYDSVALQGHVRELLRAIIVNFERKHTWRLREINAAIEKLDNDINQLV